MNENKENNRINIKPFEEITNADISKSAKDNPLYGYSISPNLFHNSEDIFLGFESWDIQHWKSVLENRLLSININFGYAMFYYYKGIPDDEWFVSPGKQGNSVQYFPHYEEQHYSNAYNFNYFVDVFFLKAYTVYETIGHLLFKLYNFESNVDDPRDQVSFNSALYKTKNINRPLYRDLNKIKHSNDFKIGVGMRNDVAHNHPPYQVDSGMSTSNGVVTMSVGKYTTSKAIKEAMIGLLRSIKATFEVLERYLPKRES